MSISTSLTTEFQIGLKRGKTFKRNMTSFISSPFDFRAAKGEHVMLIAKFAPSKGKHGKLYASKPVYSIQQGFSVPKASPLQVNSNYHLIISRI